MRVAILTMFKHLFTTYSLVNVVEDQLKMFLDHNISVRLIVSESCNDTLFGVYTDKRIEWVRIKEILNGNPIKIYNYLKADTKLHDTFNEEVEMYASEFEKALLDIDFCLMHDILYQGWNYVYNMAIRKAQKKLSNVKFFSFTHSSPFKRPKIITESIKGRFTPMDNNYFVCPSYSMVESLAKQYNVPKECCKVVYNCPPILNFMSEEVKELDKKVNLLDSEILIIYPARLIPTKKFDKVAALGGCIKKTCDKSVKIIFCDIKQTHNEMEYRKYIQKKGIEFGLKQNEMIFTSEYGFPNGLKRNSILDLYTLSNLFILPSYSEMLSLSVLEAASRGNFLVLNKHVPALYEAGKNLGAYFMEWDAYDLNTIKVDYIPSELNLNYS